MLYSTYRPQTFEEVVGQEKNLVTLRKQSEAKKFDSAYLFAGHRGTGKTTIARILSRTICCEGPTAEGPCNQCGNCKSILANKTLDCIELDAASHNSIADVKELVASTRYLPTILPKRIYIIDEAHNLSSSAFDALLKTIEEPPEHCIFVLCTTELHKIPATIRSRCSIYQFSALSIETIRGRLAYVLNEMGKEFEGDAVNLIAKQADGSMRDALSIMEKLIVSCGKMTLEHVQSALGLMDDEHTLGILSAVVGLNGNDAVKRLQKLYEEGKSLSQLADNLIFCLTDGIVLRASVGGASVHNTKDYKSSLYQLVKNCPLTQLFWYVDQFCGLREKIRNSLNPYMDVLLQIVRCCNPTLLNDSAQSVLSRVARLEDEIQRLKGRNSPPPEKAPLADANRSAETGEEATFDGVGSLAVTETHSPEEGGRHAKSCSTANQSVNPADSEDGDSSVMDASVEDDHILSLLSDYL